MPQYKIGEWKYEFKMSSFTTTILNLLFTEAELKSKTRHFRMYIGPGSDGSSADKLSLDFKFNPWDTAITLRPECRSMSKTVFTQHDPFETWYTCQSDVWLDDVKTFYRRPMCCVIVVHPYPLAQEDTTLLTDSACLSCAKICIDDSRFSPDLHKDKRVTLNKRQKNEISNSAAVVTETIEVLWSLLTNTIPHGRTNMKMVILATEASMMAVGHFSKIFDPGKNGQQLTDDSVTRLKNEFATNDPNVVFSYILIQDDDTERPVEMCSLEMPLLQNANASDKVIIIADTRHTQRWSEREVDPTLCKGVLAFFWNCLVPLENLRLWAHERTPSIPRNVDDLETVEFADVLGAIAEDQHLTRCSQVCFTGTDDDQAEQHDHGTIDEVLGDQDMEQGGDAPEEADREADFLNKCLYPVTQNPKQNV